MDDYSYSQALEVRAVARRAAQANGQALSEKVAELAYARPMADAAHAYCAMFDAAPFPEQDPDVWELHEALLASHAATTPSAVPSSHVIVERAELERLRAIERRTRIAVDMVWSEVSDGYQDGYRDAATQILGAGT